MSQTIVAPDLLDSRRDPLPPGHPFTWALITAGTSLEGSPYAPQPAATHRSAFRA